jgi:hypothetical protein
MLSAFGPKRTLGLILSWGRPLLNPAARTPELLRLRIASAGKFDRPGVVSGVEVFHPSNVASPVHEIEPVVRHLDTLPIQKTRDLKVLVTLRPNG